MARPKSQPYRSVGELWMTEPLLPWLTCTTSPFAHGRYCRSLARGLSAVAGSRSQRPTGGTWPVKSSTHRTQKVVPTIRVRFENIANDGRRQPRCGNPSSVERGRARSRRQPARVLGGRAAAPCRLVREPREDHPHAAL